MHRYGSLSAYNIEGWTLYPATESFCTLQILIKAINVFERMKKIFYLEKTILVYIQYILGIYTGNVYIPGIYLVYTVKTLSKDSR